MKKCYGFFLGYFSIFTTVLFGQITWQHGIEAGASFSQWTFNHKAENIPVAGKFLTNKERDKPTLGILMGATTQANLGKNWVGDFALQFQTTGRKRIENTTINETATSTSPIGTDDFTEKQVFLKIAAPLAIGYKWAIKDNFLGFYLGFRANWLLSGNYSMTRKNIVSNTTVVSQDVKAKVFDANSFSVMPKRNLNQFFAALSFQFDNKVEISARLNISPSSIKYQLKDPTLCNGDCVIKMRNDDLQLAIRYFLFK